MIWNPHAFTILGQPLAPAAPPVLHVMGGQQASAAQMSMAQATFARFCDEARASFVPNPSETGYLADGTAYEISVVGNSSVMEIWPVSGDAPQASGVQFDLMTADGARTFLLSAQAQTGSRRHTGRFKVRKLNNPLPGGTVVSTNKSGDKYVVCGKRGYSNWPIAAHDMPLDTAAAANIHEKFNSFSFRSKSIGDRFVQCDMAFVHTSLEGKAFAMSVTFEPLKIITAVIPFEGEGEQIQTYETATDYSDLHYLCVDVNGRNAFAQGLKNGQQRHARLRFSETGCHVVGDAGLAEWGQETTEEIYVPVNGRYLPDQGACGESSVFVRTYLYDAIGPVKRDERSTKKEKNLANYLRDGSAVERKSEYLKSDYLKHELNGSSTSSTGPMVEVGGTHKYQVTLAISEIGWHGQGGTLTEGGVPLIVMNDKRVYDNNSVYFGESNVCPADFQAYDYFPRREYQRVEKTPIFIDPLSGFEVYTEYRSEYYGDSIPNPHEQYPNDFPDAYEYDEQRNIVISHQGTSILVHGIDQANVSIAWARDPRAEVMVVHVYTYTVSGGPGGGEPVVIDSWSYVVSPQMCQALRSLLETLGVLYTGDIIRNSNFLSI